MNRLTLSQLKKNTKEMPINFRFQLLFNLYVGEYQSLVTEPRREWSCVGEHCCLKGLPWSISSVYCLPYFLFTESLHLLCSCQRTNSTKGRKCFQLAVDNMWFPQKVKIGFLKLHKDKIIKLTWCNVGGLLGFWDSVRESGRSAHSTPPTKAVSNWELLE